MNKTFEKIYSENNTILNKDMALKENTALFEKVYAEAEMLNEMNPKLRALLAAGLIGTAGLGATSCSTPNDDPTGYEQPAPETPSNPAPENPNNPNLDDPDDNNGGGGEETVTFESLGVTPEHAAHLIGADKYEDNVTTIITIDGYSSFVYKNIEDGFVPVEFDRDGEYKDGSSYISYINDTDDTDWYLYYVPVSREHDFDQAIAAYKAAHAE